MTDKPDSPLDAAGFSAQPERSFRIRMFARRYTALVWKRGAVFLDRASKWAVLIAAIIWMYDTLLLKPGREHRQHIKDSWATIYQAWGKPGGEVA